MLLALCALGLRGAGLGEPGLRGRQGCGFFSPLAFHAVPLSGPGEYLFSGGLFFPKAAEGRRGRGWGGGGESSSVPQADSGVM